MTSPGRAGRGVLPLFKHGDWLYWTEPVYVGWWFWKQRAADRLCHGSVYAIERWGSNWWYQVAIGPSKWRSEDKLFPTREGALNQ